MNPREIIYLTTKLRKVVHTTINPNGPGAVRIHLVPPKFNLKASDIEKILKK